jgi:hypothetical protein
VRFTEWCEIKEDEMSRVCNTHLSNSGGGNQQLVVVDPHDGASFVSLLLVQLPDGLPQGFQRAVGEFLVHSAISLQKFHNFSYSFSSKTHCFEDYSLMEAARPPETLVTRYQSTGRHIQVDYQSYQ